MTNKKTYQMILFLTASIVLLLPSCFGPIVGAECTEGLEPCKNGCVEIANDINNCGSCGNSCKTGEECLLGQCTLCEVDQLECNESCFDPMNDPVHCGSCNNSCEDYQTCVLGTCTGCPSPLTQCNDNCTDVQSDPENCGTCNTSCDSEAPVCLNGSCTLECPPWMSMCDNKCFDITNDQNNCGACDVVCPDSNPFCINSTCTLTCSDETTDCFGQCVDTTIDPSNCGTCQNVCTGLDRCEAGDCVSSCTPPLTDCAGSCINTEDNKWNCGECGKSCDQNEICLLSNCQISCGETQIVCNDNCISYLTDRNNCGDCNIKCNDIEVCQNGVCIPDCGSLEYCAPGCVDTYSDNAHCGTCNYNCDTGNYCVNGQCLLDCPASYTACDDQCVNTDINPFHCGTCDKQCDTGICIDGTCKIESPGHLILIGHDYNVTHTVLDRIVANGIFISPNSNVSVLGYVEYSDKLVHVKNVNDAIDRVANAQGRSWSFAEAATEQDILDNILEYDVLFLYQQSSATDLQLTTIGNNLFSKLREFMSVGGIIIMTDGGIGNDGTWQILDNAALFEISSSQNCTDCTVKITDPGDALAQGVSTYYLGTTNTQTYITSEGYDLAEDDSTGLPILFHKVYKP